MIEKISKDERVLIHLTTKKNGEGQPRTYGILVVHPTNSEDNEEIFVKDGDLVPVLNLLLVNKNATNCVLDDIANLVNELHVSKLNAVQRLLEDARDKVSGLNSATDEEHEKVVKAGGLYIIGTERHESRRIDNQLRGRAGRQGDPGTTCFYVSMEDDLMRRFGADRMNGMLDRLSGGDDINFNFKIFSRNIESA